MTREILARAVALLDDDSRWPRFSRRKRLFFWFIQRNRRTWYIAFMLLNIDQPRRARQHFKARYPWVYCERLK